MIARFYDKVASGFYDAESPREGVKVLGALAARRKPLQDSPTPAGNPSAVSALLRLEALNGNQQYREIAEDTLESFAGIVEHFGLYAGTYGLALERLLLDPIQIVIVGTAPWRTNCMPPPSCAMRSIRASSGFAMTSSERICCRLFWPKHYRICRGFRRTRLSRWSAKDRSCLPPVSNPRRATAIPHLKLKLIPHRYPAKGFVSCGGLVVGSGAFVTSGLYAG